MKRFSKIISFSRSPSSKTSSNGLHTDRCKHGGPSTRGQNSTEIGKQLERMLKVLSDVYDPETNPDGYINIGVAENYLMLNDSRDFVNEKISIDRAAMTYGPGATGSPALKQAFAKFWNERFRPYTPVEPAHTLFAAGCTALAEMIGWTLANQGDAILMSAPMYGTFNVDFVVKAGLHVEYVSTGGDHPTNLTSVPYYEKAILELQARGIAPRILLLCNPHNPLGTFYDKETLTEFCNLCARYNLHLVSDEVYAMSAFRIGAAEVRQGQADKSPFTSLLSLHPATHSLPSSHMHVMYGFSKDFAAGGIRLGCLISQSNAELHSALGGVSLMHYVGGVSDRIATAMLTDNMWLDNFVAKSQDRLKECYLLSTQILDNVGIEYFSKGEQWFAGFSLWVNLGPYLSELKGNSSGQATFDLEDVLMERVLSSKVWINPGKSFSSDRPGWFRIVYSQEAEILREGLRRVLEIIFDSDAARKAIAI